MIIKEDYAVEGDSNANCDAYRFYHDDNDSDLEDFAVLRNPDTGETLLENHTDLKPAEIVATFFPTSVLGRPDEDNYYTLTLSEADFAWLSSVVVDGEE